MKILGFDLGALIGKLLPSLTGWKLTAGIALAAFVAGGWAMHHYDGLQADRAALARERAYSDGLRLINAANDAAAEIAAEHARRALEAVEAAAKAERERAAALEAQLAAIRAIPEAENCPLGLETMKILEGLM